MVLIHFENYLKLLNIGILHSTFLKNMEIFLVASGKTDGEIGMVTLPFGQIYTIFQKWKKASSKVIIYIFINFFF